ncbi:MAG: ethanolamine ammonia-lyase reactivating factor EutA [Mycobacterium sp.]
MHDDDFDHEHEVGLTQAEREVIARAIVEQDTLELLTVGIDIGSSTSHLLFARVVLQRQTHDLSSRFVVIDRQVVWASPILLTPFLSDGSIDAHALSHFVHDAYHSAGITRDDVDSGAVILTGEAIKRSNARAIDEIFASQSGRFVCATAGHRLESILAAHGSGAVALSAKRHAVGLHVDIGGGTTKLALIDNGEIRDVAAFAVGGRLLAQDSTGLWTRVDDSAVVVAEELGIATTPESLSRPETRATIARRLAELVVDQIVGTELDPLGRQLELTETLTRSAQPAYISFSGGVSEYVFGREKGYYGDISLELAAEIVSQLRNRVTVPSVEVGQRIRATVIGASQFTVQVSGKTILLTDPEVLPFQNIPVVHLGDTGTGDIDPGVISRGIQAEAQLHEHDIEGPVALAFGWSGLPSYDRLLAMAEGVVGALDPESDVPLVLVNDGDIGQTLGRILQVDLGLRRPLVSLDGIELKPLDFVDIGERLDPPGVVPVVIKSLLFS